MSSEANAVWVIGSLNVDITLNVPALPRPGETVVGGQLEIRPGGKGANQAVACGRQGVPTHLVACVGSDLDPRWAQRFAGHGVHTHFVTSPDQRTGVALVMVEESGENLIGIFAGANSALSPGDLPIKPGDLVLLQCEISARANVEAAASAKAKGARVILNAAPVAPIPSELLSNIDLVVVNELEAAALDLESVPWTVITAGAAGARLRGRDGTVHEQPGFSVEAVDTVGAGDTFTGVLAAAWLSGQSLPDAVTWACAAAAIAVTRHGIHESAPSAAEVSAFLQENR